jgi:hypothetical protein
MKENCNNCYQHLRYGCGGQGDFQENSRKSCFKYDYPVLEDKIKEMQTVIDQCKDTFEKIIPMEIEKIDGSIYLTKSGKLSQRILKVIEEFENEALKEISKEDK